MLECELKLLIDRKDQAELPKSACIAQLLQEPFKRKRVQNAYFDTPDADLRQRGMELRVRRIDRQWIQTLKIRQAGGAAVHRREEIETPVSGPTPVPALLIEAGAPDALVQAIGDAGLECLFETVYWRRSAILKAAGGNIIELCLDVGETRAGERVREISEIEMELKQGANDALYNLAEELAQTFDLRINSRTKPDLGYGMLRDERPEPVYDHVHRIDSGESAEAAFQHFLEECARHAFANDRTILETDNIEGVHQMRVGLRRFRACLNLFKPLLPGKAVRAAGDLISPLQQALGPARDWDVFIRDRIDRFPQTDDAMTELRALAVVERDQAYASLRELLNTTDHHRSLLTLLSWIGRRGWREALSAKQLGELERPIDAFVKEALQRTRAKALKRGRKLADLSPKQLHQLRIVVKKHRYPVDFFAASFAGKRGRVYAAALKKLQTDLGRVNDVTVSGDLIAKLDPPKRLQPTVKILLARAEEDRLNSLSKLPERWRAFRKQRPFWKGSLGAKQK